MKCEKYLTAIEDLIEGDLEEQTAYRLYLHISACQECAARYELLKREKDLYGQFLLNMEPPADLFLKFQATVRAEAVKNSQTKKLVTRLLNWKINLPAFWRLSPAITIASLLIFGVSLVLMNAFLNEKKVENNHVAVAEINKNQIKQAETFIVDSYKVKNSQADQQNNKTDSTSQVKREVREELKSRKLAVAPLITPARIKETKIKSNTMFTAENEDSAKILKPAEEERIRMLQLKDLEKETTKQFGRVELLLRSFRNARLVEESGIFDVAYEKEQARKLLEKNVQLRRNSENYGILYAEELLGKIEPILLDIANLENNPSLEEVYDIKNRLKNQSIIASLQSVY